jgi:cell division protein FtsQ
MARKRARVTSRASTRREMQAEMLRRKARDRRRVITRRLGLLALASLALYALLATYGVMGTRPAEHLAAWRKGFFALTADIGFRVEEVTLEGREVADKKALEKALGIARSAPILEVSLTGMQAALEQIPEVEQARVTRHLPNRIAIVIVERAPAVLWQAHGKLTLLDKHGAVLDRKKYVTHRPLPLMVGEDAPKHLKELLALLAAAPELEPEIQAAIRVGERRWNMKLKNEMTVLLPAEGAIAAWRRFAQLSKREALLARSIRSVDMRIEDRIYITPVAPDASPITLTNARET